MIDTAGDPLSGSRRRFVAVPDDPLDAIAGGHVVVLRTCDAMERFADRLPDSVDLSTVDMLIAALAIDLVVHLDDEERGLMPILSDRAKPADNFSAVRSCICQEHAMDRGYALEVVAHLEHLQQQRRLDISDANMTGYMLRGFFETQRRRLAWENALIMPMARQRLGDRDLRRLRDIMVENRKRRGISM